MIFHKFKFFIFFPFQRLEEQKVNMENSYKKQKDKLCKIFCAISNDKQFFREKFSESCVNFWYCTVKSMHVWCIFFNFSWSRNNWKFLPCEKFPYLQALCFYILQKRKCREIFLMMLEHNHHKRSWRLITILSVEHKHWTSIDTMYATVSYNI